MGVASTAEVVTVYYCHYLTKIIMTYVFQKDYMSKEVSRKAYNQSSAKKKKELVRLNG